MHQTCYILSQWLSLYVKTQTLVADQNCYCVAGHFETGYAQHYSWENIPVDVCIIRYTS